MKKQELLKYFDDELLEKLFGFCYARAKDSHEAEELCSDILYALVNAAGSDGEIENIYSFIWKVARNVYDDFSKSRKKRANNLVQESVEEILLSITEDDDDPDDTADLLRAVYRRIAFLTRAYREVMIMFYINGLSTSEIAKKQGTSEGAIRQRLFSARQKIRSEVEEMKEANNIPVALDRIDYVIWGTGSPAWGDPREGFTRMLSKHIVWLCHKKPMSATEIAEELNVPTVYVEEELEILRKGENGQYGFLRRLDNGKYAINFILFDRDTFEKANELYTKQLPQICDIISKYVREHKDEYLAFPYLNKRVDMNLILWQQIMKITSAFEKSVECIMEKKHFADVPCVKRPFSVFGYVDNGKYYGGGCDGADAKSICGYSSVHVENIYITRIKKHFSCGVNLSRDLQIQLAIRSIEGLNVSVLSEDEKEQAAKAIECGYLFREGNMLYTKILVNEIGKCEELYKVSEALLTDGSFDRNAELIADELARLIKKAIPDHLIGEWKYANYLANLPVLDAVVECLIEKGALIPPKDGIGAEGCWMCVEK